jgi:ornithine cyclodeaminase
VATRILARKDATTLGILGTGVQARTHLEAMLLARDVRQVRVFSRSEANRRRFARDESERHGIEVVVADSAREAVEGADIVCTTTSSPDPVLFGEWLAPGTHINAVGSSTPTARELDTQAVVRSRMFVDRRESAFHEAGDFLIPRNEGAVSEAHVLGEIGEVILGGVRGRDTENDITLFKSLGLAVEDLAAADLVYRRAREQGRGTEVQLTEPPREAG